MTVAAIIVAAGRGTRMTGPTRKQYRLLAGRPILARTLSVFGDCPAVDRIFLVIPPLDIDFCRYEILPAADCRKTVTLVPGGAQRRDSVYNGITATGCSRNDIVVIHDGVRPFTTGKIITACIQAAKVAGACIVGIPVHDTLKRVDDTGHIDRTVDRQNLWLAQTPQAFRYHLIKKAHETAMTGQYDATDDAALMESMGTKVRMVPGSIKNLKITTREDLVLADAILRSAMKGR